MSENRAEVFRGIEGFARLLCDGHFTIMKFTTNWRVSFGSQPDGRHDIGRMAVGSTLSEAFAGAAAQWAIEAERDTRTPAA